MVNPAHLNFTIKTWVGRVNLINMTEGKYLYCIIKESKPQKFWIDGIEGKEVYSVTQGKLAGVVSNSEIKEYFLTRENLLTHQKVIEEVSKQYNALPISFGTVAANSEELKEKILEPRAKELQGLLENIDGKIELGLKALWIDTKSIFREIAENSPTIRNLKKSKNTSYQQRIAAGELVGKILGEKREEEKDKILEPLIKIAVDYKENEMLGEDMVLNAAFLVKKTKEKEFDKVVQAIGKKFDGRIKFMYVGPMPPFNFVELRLSTK